jgi:hypothetical protein
MVVRMDVFPLDAAVQATARTDLKLVQATSADRASKALA